MTASGLTTTATVTCDVDYEKGSALANIEARYDADESMLFGNRLGHFIDNAAVVTPPHSGGLNWTVRGQVSVTDAACSACDVSPSTAEYAAATIRDLASARTSMGRTPSRGPHIPSSQ